MENKKIAIIGLGYVGLPLAVEFGRKFEVVGFDINKKRISELSIGDDFTLETTKEQILSSTGLTFSSENSDLAECNFYIITVPTPVDKNNKPDLTPLIKASETVGKVLKKGDIVVYESTVYPGCTEEDCVPVLEKTSGLVFNQDFYCGYSPERINPGDKEHTVTKILKITSGSTAEIAEIIDQVYRTIIVAGTFKAASIKVAEAAKVIENSQRDINIAFVNELAKIFNKLGIDTNDVLEAAGTKWNFMKFKPGLVGGHCIGVDPYYLTFKSQELGYYPEIILAGRKLNDRMGAHIANQVMKLMKKKNHNIDSAEVLMLGITFKENCTDIRNSKAIDIVNELREFGAIVDVYDPLADKHEVEKEYSIILTDTIDKKNYKAIILAVAHDEFLNIDFSSIRSNNTVVFDVKSILPIENIDGRL